MRTKSAKTSDSSRWIAKVSRILIFIFGLSIFMYQGWYQPKEAEAADTLSVTGNTAIAISPKNDTAAYVVMQRFQVDSSGTDGSSELNSLTLDDAGNTLNIAAVRVYVSTASSATLPVNAVLIGKITAWNGNSQAITLNLGTAANRTVTNGASKYIYIAYDMASGESGKTAQSHVTVVGVAAPDNGATGLNLSSNLITLNAGVKATVVSCADCHGNPPVDSATRDSATGRFKGSHNKHAGSQPSDLGLTCTICHVDNGTNTSHRNSLIEMAAPINGDAGATYSKTASFAQVDNPTMGACNNVYCHSTVQGAGGSGAGTDKPQTWATAGPLGCGACHSDMSVSGAPGSHDKHVQAPNSYACNNCHSGYTSSSTDNSIHANKTINVIAGLGYDGGTTSGDHSPGGGYAGCSTASCHVSAYGSSYAPTPTWGTTAGCGACHPIAANGAPSTGSHTKHVDGGALCGACHAGAVKDSSGGDNHINTTVEVTNGYSASPVAKHPSGSYTGNCTTASCHSNGTGIWTGSPSSSPTPVWGDTTAGCSACHGGYGGYTDYRKASPLYASGTPKPNAHRPHTDARAVAGADATECNDCHRSVTATNTAIDGTTPADHAAGSYSVTGGTQTYANGDDVSANVTVSMTYAPNTTPNASTCSNVTCHPTGLGGTKPAIRWNDADATDFQCTDCHNIDLTANTAYHHSLNNATYTPNAATGYPTTIPDGDWSSGTNAASRTCLMCHVKHNISSNRMNTDAALTAPRAMNLRTAIGTTPAAGSGYINSDYIAGTGGICISCHSASRTKDQTRQKADTGATTTPAVVEADYNVSSHDYDVARTMKTGGAAFNANCSKCHTGKQGEGTTTFQTAAAGGSVGTHDSTDIGAITARRLLSALGIQTAPATDSLEEKFCYRCHSRSTEPTNAGPLQNPGGGPNKTTADRDYYGVQPNGVNMSATSQLLWRDVNTASGTTRAGSTTTVVNVSGDPGWTAANQWAGYTLKVGTAARRITANAIGNNISTITVTPAFAAAPGTGVAFQIGGKHDMTLANGKHKPIEGTASNDGTLSGTNRHAECEDCHSPHAAKDGTANYAGTVAASGSTTTTLVASGTPNWPTNRWKGYLVNITTTGRGQARYVVSNTNNTLTIVGSFTAAPTAGDAFTLVTRAWEEAGVATAGTATTLTDSSKSTVWTNNLWAGYYVKTVSGTGAEQVRAIVSNTTTALTVAAWNTNPAVGTGYVIYRPPTVAGVNAGVNGASADIETDGPVVGMTGTPANMRNTAYSAKATVEYQYELCLACHSTWAYGTEASAPSVPTPYAQNGAYDNYGTTKTQTDVGKDFDPDNYAYHPLFAPGKHQPIRMGNASANAPGQVISYNSNRWPSYGYNTTTAGTVSATNGSRTLTFAGAASIPAGVGAGYWIHISSGTAAYIPTNPTTTGVGGGGYGWWPIASRNSATQITLAATYGGTTATGRTYMITKGFKSTFVDGWGPESLTTCTDCHNTSDNTGAAIAKARGPHGSANRWLLRFQEAQTVTAINGTVAATTVTNRLTYCLNCHNKNVYGDAPIAGTFTAPTNSNYGRVSHDAWDACVDNNGGGNFQQVNCTNCHGGQGATAGQAGVGTLHGNNIGVAASGTSPFGFRFQNGASWDGKTISLSSTACYNPATAVANISSCSHGHDGATEAINYQY